jgi:membrane protein YdbS with pleckstrin-like domain
MYKDGKRKKTTHTRTVDETDIEILNSQRFCYKKLKTYKELLYDGQIIKQNENCKENYKSCGIIDTLNQILCVKNEENCPLKDIQFGKNSDTNSYTYNSISDISYNNNNYNGDKKIIGHIVLNHGQPCFSVLDKLWKKFSSKEAGDGHLKCKTTIENMENDERYEAIGQVTYFKLYMENLNSESQNILLGNLGDEKVTLYKREFLGIDKNCDEKLNISRDTYDKLKKNQKRVKTLLLCEFIILLVILFILLMLKLKMKEQNVKIFYVFSIICLLYYVSIIICFIIFLVGIKKNDLFYDCSDDITNEYLKEENNNTKKSIKIVAINLVLDIVAIILFLIMYFYILKKNKWSFKNYEYKENKENKENNNNQIFHTNSDLKQNKQNEEQFNEEIPIKEKKEEPNII